MTSSLFLTLGIMFVAGLACGSITSRLGLTRISGELVAGILIGKSVLGQINPALEARLFGEGELASIQVISTVLTLVYVTQVGARLAPEGPALPRRGLVAGLGVASGIAVLSAVALGGLVGGFVPEGESMTGFVLFISGAFLIAALPVLASILDETNLTQTRLGASLLVFTVWADFVAFTVAAPATAAARSTVSPVLLVGPVLFLVLVLVGGRLARLVSRLERRDTRLGVEVGVLLAALAIASSVEASTLVTAFTVGASVWRPNATDPLEAASSARLFRVLVSIYIVYSGVNVDLAALGGRGLVIGACLVLALAVVGKSLSGAIVARMLRLPRHDVALFAVLGNARGLTELILLNQGLAAGVLSDAAYAAFYLTTIVATVGSSTIAGRLLRRPEGPSPLPSRR